MKSNSSMREGIRKLYYRIRFHWRKLINHLFNEIVREQNKNYKKIPVLIISYNQLSSLKRLVEVLQKNGHERIVIIDNKSTYQPLLEYFDRMKTQIRVHKLPQNYGHRVLWKRPDIFTEYFKGYYALTDPDVIPVADCPPDFVQKFKKILDKNPDIDKVGFSLSIDKIPVSNPKRLKIINWEKRYWTVTDKEGNYIAEIDTTFALYRPGKPFISYKGIRTRPPYVAVHEGWNIDLEDLSPEQEHYMKTANSSASWNAFLKSEDANEFYGKE